MRERERGLFLLFCWLDLRNLWGGGIFYGSEQSARMSHPMRGTEGQMTKPNSFRIQSIKEEGERAELWEKTGKRPSRRYLARFPIPLSPFSLLFGFHFLRWLVSQHYLSLSAAKVDTVGTGILSTFCDALQVIIFSFIFLTAWVFPLSAAKKFFPVIWVDYGWDWDSRSTFCDASLRRILFFIRKTLFIFCFPNGLSIPPFGRNFRFFIWSWNWDSFSTFCESTSNTRTSPTLSIFP